MIAWSGNAAQLLGDALQDRAEIGLRPPVEGDAAAQAAAREVEQVVDQPVHALAADADDLREALGLVRQRHAQHHLGGADGGVQRRAQVVADDGDELLAQFGRLLLVEQQLLAAQELFLVLQLQCDEPGEALEGRERAGTGQLHRPGIERTQGAEDPAVAFHYRYRDIAFEAVELRAVVLAPLGMRAHLVDDDGDAGALHLVADGGLDGQLGTRRHAETDLVAYGAGGPAVGRDAGDRGKAEAGGLADDAQDVGQRGDAVHRRDLFRQPGRLAGVGQAQGRLARRLSPQPAACRA